MTDNRRVARGRSTVPLSEVWYEWTGRRQYLRGFAFVPNGPAPEGKLNLWTGWGVEPQAGDCDAILSFLRDVICGGNEVQFNYLVSLLAYWVQNPEKPGEVAIVLRSGQGTGKGTLGRLMTTIFGTHGMHVSQARHVTGNFNAHLADCCFLFADEAFFAGDRQSASALKALITEQTLAIEAKGVDTICMPNRLKVIMAGNPDWVVAAEGDDRRFFAPDMSEKRKQDHNYFAELNAEIDNGGAAAFLHHLLNLDLSDFNPRQKPDTKELARQKEQSLAGVEAFAYELLGRGSLTCQLKPMPGHPLYGTSPSPDPEDRDDLWRSGPVAMGKDALYARYREWANERGNRYRSRDVVPSNRFFQKLNALLPDAVRPHRISENGRRRQTVEIGKLEEARAAFFEATGVPVEDE